MKNFTKDASFFKEYPKFDPKKLIFIFSTLGLKNSHQKWLIFAKKITISGRK